VSGSPSLPCPQRVARYLAEEQMATFEWPFGAIVVRGPKTLEFFESFCAHKVTGAKADGNDITSVTFRSLTADQSVES
jgi:hypothetical protein